MTPVPVTVEATAPGKILVAGEYAILSPGARGLVLAVKGKRLDDDGSPHGGQRGGAGVVRPVLVSVSASSEGEREGGLRVRAPDVGVSLAAGRLEADAIEWSQGAQPAGTGDPLRFVRCALALCVRVLRDQGIEPRPCEIAIRGDSRKLGLGSSAAVTVALAGAMLAFHGSEVDGPDARRRLAAIALHAHRRAQDGRGSGFDVVAATFGGLGEFVSGDLGVLGRALGGEGRLASVLEEPPGLPQWLPLDWPRGLGWAAGWTGVGADTVRMIESIERLGGEARRAVERGVVEIGRVSGRLAADVREGRAEAFIDGVGTLNRTLLDMTAATGLPFVSDRARRLVEIAGANGCPGKPLGAGGGDSGICFSTSEEALARTRTAWRENGIVPLDLEPAPEGLVVRSAGA